MKQISHQLVRFFEKEIGYNTNKIENENLTLKAYKNYYYSSPIPDVLDRTILETLNIDELYRFFNKIEIQNYKTIITQDFVNFDFDQIQVTKDFSIQINKKLLNNLTIYPFNQYFTKAFAQYLDKQDQTFKTHNVLGELRKSDLWKEIDGELIKFYGYQNLEHQVDEIFQNLNKDLQDAKRDEEKYQAINLFHLNFELLHPFAEGNGRTGRILVDILCLQNNLFPLNFSGANNDEGYFSNIKNILFVKQQKQDFALFKTEPLAWKDYRKKVYQETLSLLKNKYNITSVMQMFS
ncbi:Fic family protein [Williamsoniiplasma lucivorax]|uniref:Fido domain-containing protein n=1 Tax=Williamsoniiplasma lucivorax TaxID=209274 RepID=A0A2S5RA01_9MOLU|nr:Fic family protein [Williamsoniiplasma lucivorax]PPE04156.1 hypothetical protein ELUCI_v1c09360 [Williamsoniiplasma lucivorax]